MIYIIGAGLAGLSAAITLHDAGHAITLLDSAQYAGGRCRSYDDRELGCRIDNGNHLLLSGNRAAYAYLDRLGTAGTMGGPATPLFPFMDIVQGEYWTLRPGEGRSPLWIFDKSRRVPGTGITDYLALARWLRARPGQVVSDIARPSLLTTRLIDPLAIAALNTMPDEGDATLMAAVIRKTLLAGGAACIPAFPRTGLSESFIDPALAVLAQHPIQLGRRVNALETADSRITTIGTTDGPIPLAPEDDIILAVPAPVAAALLPGLTVPTEFESILNLHFRSAPPENPAGFLGLVGGLSEWLFFKPGIISVTISAANRYADLAPEAAAFRAWHEIQRACAFSAPLPPYRVVREKRATFAATPEQNRRRPPTATAFQNLALAGDWTQTGLPATIEGTIQSGTQAALHLTRRTPRP